MIALLLAFVAADQAVPVLPPAAACHIAQQDRVDAKRPYSIRGHYFSDGMHRSELELPGCKDIIFPVIVGHASAMIEGYRSAFRIKCGGYLIGGGIDGVFTARFVRRRAQLFGFMKPAMVNFFEVQNIKTDQLDASSIACPK